MLTLNGSVITSPAGYWFDKFIDYNPYNLPDGTIRFKFSDLSYNPVEDPQFTPPNLNVWTQVSANPNIWDCVHHAWISYPQDDPSQVTYGPISYDTGFGGSWDDPNNLVEVIAFNTKGIARDVDGTYSLRYMFHGCTSLTKMCPFDASDVYTTDGMFYRCTSLVEFPETYFPKLTNGFEMFYRCYALDNVIMHTPQLVTAKEMFMQCTSLTNVYLDTPNATSTVGLFNGCSNLVNIPYLDTSNVTDFTNMFSGTAITQFPNFDYSNANDFGIDHIHGGISQICQSCTALQSVPDINVPNCGKIAMAFDGCTSLKHIPNINCARDPDSVSYVFRNCVNAESGIYASYINLSSKTPSRYNEAFKNCGSNTTTGAAELAQIPSDWK